jgi:hypothetical protein
MNSDVVSLVAFAKWLFLPIALMAGKDRIFGETRDCCSFRLQLILTPHTPSLSEILNKALMCLPILPTEDCEPPTLNKTYYHKNVWLCRLILPL